MNQIKNSFSSIEQMTSKLCQPTGKTSGSSQAKGSFQEILFGKNQEETGQETYAQQKGIVESLVMVDSYAFIVNTRNNVVVTAVTQGDEKVFTNIDGAVIG